MSPGTGGKARRLDRLMVIDIAMAVVLAAYALGEVVAAHMWPRPEPVAEVSACRRLFRRPR